MFRLSVEGESGGMLWFLQPHQLLKLHPRGHRHVAPMLSSTLYTTENPIIASMMYELRLTREYATQQCGIVLLVGQPLRAGLLLLFNGQHLVSQLPHDVFVIEILRSRIDLPVLHAEHRMVLDGCGHGFVAVLGGGRVVDREIAPFKKKS